MHRTRLTVARGTRASKWKVPDAASHVQRLHHAGRSQRSFTLSRAQVGIVSVQVEVAHFGMAYAGID